LIFREFLSQISDAFFPRICLACSCVLPSGRPEFFCTDCLRQITFLRGRLCPACGITFSDSSAGNHLCSSCIEHQHWFDFARAAVAYEGIILDAIHRFKYGRDLTAGAALAGLLADFDFAGIDFSAFDAMIPMPLHIKRLRERRFNQSLVLARALGKKHGVAVDFSLLKRRRFTLTQTGLNKSQRDKNISGAFAANRPDKIRGGSFLLVDDVYTTGATINECAKILVEAGAKRVAALTVARVL
jgi:ComF family protein